MSVSALAQQIQSISETKNSVLVGITGPIASGKTTLAEKITTHLSLKFIDLNIINVCTDSFLYTNEQLKYLNIFHEKGYPWSFDLKKFQRFLLAIKSGHGFHEELYQYSQDLKDLNLKNKISINPDSQKKNIYLIEGIALLFKEQQHLECYAHMCDFSVYIDVAEEELKYRSINRFLNSWRQAQLKPNDYFKDIINWPKEKVESKALTIWEQVNSKLNKNYLVSQKPYMDEIVNNIECSDD